MDIEEWEEYGYIAEGIDAFVRELGNSYLKKMVGHVCNTGGKRIRPLLLLLSSEACSTSYKNSLDAALAVEMMHSASLVHDDLLDQGLIRRNMPTAPEKFGPSQALLCGDFLIAKSIELISPYGEKVVRIFGKAGMDMAEGEVLDLQLEGKEFLERDYFDCIYRKTASLFEVSAAIGAYTAGADEALAKRLGLFGQYLGTAYQIVDDLLEFLKMIEGKESKHESETLLHIYMKEMPEEEAVKKSVVCVKGYVHSAKEILKDLDPCPAREKLFRITDYMTLDLLDTAWSDAFSD